jgi:hypothetical protein
MEVNQVTEALCVILVLLPTPKKAIAGVSAVENGCVRIIRHAHCSLQRKSNGLGKPNRLRDTN